MKKVDSFSRCLDVLRGADFEMANEDEIYRTGIIGQFNLTFELAWKALQAVLRIHGADSQTGSPREILQMGYKAGFVDDSAAWLAMLKERNSSVHIYDEDRINELILLIRDTFILAFTILEKTLEKKMEEAGSEEDMAFVKNT
ncbi:MAG: nucleotidyltransferase substrate binding protein [Lachnospiraceae bacterium]|nr:nucleotidyltransferase substrate binding protein [Lachnospiraceae bacterium]